jgi:L-alanine-DL-glutamate epimerase-like enolase superfamily enzyme
VLIDIGWCGGLSEARKIAALAQAYAKPVAPHDCTGPVSLLAGLQLAIHAPTAIFQEVVRAALSTWYGELVTELPQVTDGKLAAPTTPGLGTRLQPSLWERPDALVLSSGTWKW